MSNVTFLPTAAASPVVNRRRGRLPTTVAKLAHARPATAAVGRSVEDAYGTYSARREAAIAKVRQSSDAALLSRLEELQEAVMNLNSQVWKVTSELLYRADPGLEEAGNAKGGQA